MGESQIIAIDGPSGVGKSSVSRQVARHFGLGHLDTGAMYRAATLAVLIAEIEPSDSDAVIDLIRRVRIEQRDGGTYVDGIDVSASIRSEEVTNTVSIVAAVPEVRTMLVDLQRHWTAQHRGRAVVEGRDIGSVVFPDAEVKIYLTAEASERAKRRSWESGDDRRATEQALERRDQIDSTRQASPLSIAEGAVVIDTTDLTLAEVVDVVIAHVKGS